MNMVKIVFILASLSSFMALAVDEIHVTGAGSHFFTTKETEFDIEYRRIGHPEPGCTDVCDQFGCNRTGSGSMCQPTDSIGYPTNIRDIVTDVELEILAAPEGMELDEYFTASSSLYFKGSKKFAFLRTTTKLPDAYIQGSIRKRVKITLQPLDLKPILDSVTLDKHVSIQSGILTYGTLGSGPFKTSAHLNIEKDWDVFRGHVGFTFTESELAKYRTSVITDKGIQHRVDLNKILQKPLPKGKYTFSMRQSLDMNPNSLIVENEFRSKLESSLWYTVRAR